VKLRIVQNHVAWIDGSQITGSPIYPTTHLVTNPNFLQHLALLVLNRAHPHLEGLMPPPCSCHAKININNNNKNSQIQTWPNGNLPIRISGSQDNRGAGVGVAGDPGAVDCKKDHEHHEEKDHDGPNVRVGKVAGLVGGVNSHRSLGLGF
jgi:hypothetical protein